MIDSPVLPEELEVLPALLEQSRFPSPKRPAGRPTPTGITCSGALRSPTPRLAARPRPPSVCGPAPGEPQRELRSFDEEHYVQRAKPLALGSVQALDVPGGCEIGRRELALHPAEGHTVDGMALWIDWSGVLVAGRLPFDGRDPACSATGGSVDAYLETLERLRPLVVAAEHVVPGHGPVLDSKLATAVLEEDRRLPERPA